MILCAAIKVPDFDEDGALIVPCRRHHEGYKILYRLTGGKKFEGWEEGFVDTNGNFFNREAAYLQAAISGQLSQTTIQRKAEVEGDQKRLFSEDIY